MGWLCTSKRGPEEGSRDGRQNLGRGQGQGREEGGGRGGKSRTMTLIKTRGIHDDIFPPIIFSFPRASCLLHLSSIKGRESFNILSIMASIATPGLQADWLWLSSGPEPLRDGSDKACRRVCRPGKAIITLTSTGPRD